MKLPASFTHSVVQVCRLVGQQPCLGSNTWLSLWALHHSVTMSTVSIDVWVGQAEVTWGKPLSRWRHTDRANQTAVTSIDLNTQIKDVRKGSPLCVHVFRCVCCTSDCVVGNGWRSFGLGSWGIRSSGFTFTYMQTNRKLFKLHA